MKANWPGRERGFAVPRRFGRRRYPRPVPLRSPGDRCAVLRGCVGVIAHVFTRVLPITRALKSGTMSGVSSHPGRFRSSSAPSATALRPLSIPDGSRREPGRSGASVTVRWPIRLSFGPIKKSPHPPCLQRLQPETLPRNSVCRPSSRSSRPRGRRCRSGRCHHFIRRRAGRPPGSRPCRNPVRRLRPPGVRRSRDNAARRQVARVSHSTHQA